MVGVDTVYKADILHPSPFRFELKYKGGGIEWGRWESFLGGFFYWVVETLGGVILTIQTFFKTKNNIL